MRALVQSSAGSPLSIAEIDLPEPGPGQVRIKVEAVGLNPVDAGLVQHGNEQWAWPHVPMLDAAGTVDKLGPGVSSCSPGDRVVGHGDLRGSGAAAQYAIYDAEALAAIPASVSAAQAAALPCAAMTAYQAIHRRLHVQPGQHVVVTGANGGVGGFAVQLAHRAGAHVIALASANHQRARDLGAQSVVDYHDPDAREQILQAAPEGISAIVDTVSAENATANLSLLAHGGGIACIAGRADLESLPAFGIAPSVHEIALGAAYSNGLPRHRRDLSIMLGELLAMVAEGTLDPCLSAIIAPQDLERSIVEIREGHTQGKIVMDASALVEAGGAAG
ncbi:zinc-binding dehydrogenase [Glutamicibacter sp.]|uniref:zinc-binding dehydrogenase n=1 Tax=Glutamicibacter sp. TaxID=1931995 RepID=UPI003D6C108C